MLPGSLIIIARSMCQKLAKHDYCLYANSAFISLSLYISIWNTTSPKSSHRKVPSSNELNTPIGSSAFEQIRI